MKKQMIFSLFFLALGVNAQQSPEENIRLFFEALHKKDTASLRELTYGEVKLKSIEKDKSGTFQVTSTDFEDFLKSIGSVPENVVFEEKIHAYETKIDGKMAHVWTPYSFFVNEKLSHCGANSFQLFKNEEKWKIISILDTRRDQACEK